MVGILIWIAIGAIAGGLGSMILERNWRQIIIEDVIIGIVGGFIGGMLFEVVVVDGGVTGLNLVSLLTALVGSIVLLALLQVSRRI